MTGQLNTRLIYTHTLQDQQFREPGVRTSRTADPCGELGDPKDEFRWDVDADPWAVHASAIRCATSARCRQPYEDFNELPGSPPPAARRSMRTRRHRSIRRSSTTTSGSRWTSRARWHREGLSSSSSASTTSSTSTRRSGTDRLTGCGQRDLRRPRPQLLRWLQGPLLSVRPSTELLGRGLRSPAFFCGVRARADRTDG